MFSLKLIFKNFRQSIHHFLPFLFVSVAMFALSNIILLLLSSPVVASMVIGKDTLRIADIILLVFDVMMAIYSYIFLLRQEEKTFGLYHILGMTRKQISFLSILELFFIYLLTLIVGSLVSLVFCQFFYLIFINLIAHHQFHFKLSLMPFEQNMTIFFLIFSLLALISFVQIRKLSALQLFQTHMRAEKEPKGNILLGFLGVVMIWISYILSFTSSDVIDNMTGFFKIILLLMLGTYLFFISFIAWYLKRCRLNKRYYYHPKHFITISQLLFRMKQNAIGLANITVLASLTFITVF